MSTSTLSNVLQRESLTAKYLTVTLQREVYALGAAHVREIIRLTKITPVAQAPAYVSGVMNLRGRIIPVTDLRLKLGFRAVMEERTCIVVVEAAAAATGRPILMGLVVDEVREVVNLAGEQIVPAPYFGGSAEARDYLLGIAKVEGGVTMVLDVDRLVTFDAVDAMLRREPEGGGSAAVPLSLNK